VNLRQWLTPDWLLEGTLVDLPLQDLLDRQIAALVLDVDRTLLPRRQSALPARMRQWLEQAQQQMPIHLLSNNPSRRRIGAVARELGVPFTTSAAKPRRQALRLVLKDLGLPAHRVALIGDRVFTDVIVGNRLGLFTVLVKPIDPQGRPCQRDHLQRLELRLATWMGGSLG
jgi:HAD superfamily phosphatase (TIGR01668 family)